MQLAMGARTLGAAHPLEEDIRIAAITGYPWLVIDHDKLTEFLARPDYDIRDLKRLFLRAQPAALDALRLPDGDPAHLPTVEALCKEARRLDVPVVVARVAHPDARLAQVAEVAQRWSTVLALAPTHTAPFETVRQVVTELNHPALGLYTDLLALWQERTAPQPEDAARTVLLAVGDVGPDGSPKLPGEGVVPLGDLLAPLYAGGYDSLALLALEGVEVPPSAEALAGAGHRALSECLSAAGWTVAHE